MVIMITPKAFFVEVKFWSMFVLENCELVKLVEKCMSHVMGATT